MQCRKCGEFLTGSPARCPVCGANLKAGQETLVNPPHIHQEDCSREGHAGAAGTGAGEALRLFFRRSLDFRGRSRRGEFWWAYLGLLLINACIYGFLSLLVSSLESLSNEYPFAITVLLATLFTLVWGGWLCVAGLALCIRRLHDSGKTGWLWLLHLVPFGSLVMCILYCLPSGPDNRWGPRPGI